MNGLAACAEAIASTSSRSEKVSLLAAYLNPLSDDDFARAIAIFTGARKLSLGHSTLRTALAAVTAWDLQTISDCYRASGDYGETISLLCKPLAKNQPMSLEQAIELYSAIREARSTAEKVNLLASVFRTYAPPAVKYWAKGITGNFRIGLEAKMFEEAIAVATGAPLDSVRAAASRHGDLVQVAQAARAGALDAVEARLYHPLEFMLAQTLDRISDLDDPSEWLVEDKYDGIRAQLHVAAGRVRLFTRDLEDMTEALPEILLAFANHTGPTILDGELLTWRDGRAMSFHVLQQRLARRKVSPKTMQEFPVIFLAYDLLMHAGELVTEWPIERRRKALESLGVPFLSPQEPVRGHSHLESRFLAACDRGNEGLVVKRRGSVYELGRRGANWRKVKRPFATLDVVVTAAEQGNGRSAGVISEVTFAVRAEDRFLNIGKAYPGLTDEENCQLTKIFRSATLERFGRVSVVKPVVVLEVAFDGIQKSPRHKSGFALRVPRIVRWRRDKAAGEIDTLERVEELFRSS